MRRDRVEAARDTLPLRAVSGLGQGQEPGEPGNAARTGGCVVTHRAGQALARRLLPPIGPRVGADDPAFRANHPRSEHGHWHVTRPGRRADDGLVVASVGRGSLARRIERTGA
jgi:hypothetical protein